MFKRLTSPRSEFECRHKECEAEDWMFDIYDIYPSRLHVDICSTCPFMNIINKLAEYEDKESMYEDDLK